VSKHLGLILTLIVTTASLPCAAESKLQPTVVFVCEHGNAKSTIAAAHFNRIAEAKGLPDPAISRGINPDPEIPDNIRVGLLADGIDVSGWKPTQISEADIRSAERVVTLACEMPKSKSVSRDKLIDWANLPAVSDGYTEARAEIVRRVEELLKTLSNMKAQR